MESNSFNIKDTTIIIHNTFYLMRSQDEEYERERERHLSQIKAFIHFCILHIIKCIE